MERRMNEDQYEDLPVVVDLLDACGNVFGEAILIGYAPCNCPVHRGAVAPLLLGFGDDLDGAAGFRPKAIDNSTIIGSVAGGYLN
jgi:hypothetical protein